MDVLPRSQERRKSQLSCNVGHRGSPVRWLSWEPAKIVMRGKEDPIMKGLAAIVAAFAVLWLTIPQAFAARASAEGGDKGDTVFYSPNTGDEQ